VVFYQRPVVAPLVTFGTGFIIGSHLDMDMHWGRRVIYRPGWSWNRWNSNVIIVGGRVTRVRRPPVVVAPGVVWRRDPRRPVVLPGRVPRRNFNRFRGDVRQRPRTLPAPIPTPDRGRRIQSGPGRPLGPRPGSDVQTFRNRGNESLRRPGNLASARPPVGPRARTDTTAPSSIRPVSGPARVTRPTPRVSAQGPRQTAPPLTGPGRRTTPSGRPVGPARPGPSRDRGGGGSP
jgi:hypothetical protein